MTLQTDCITIHELFVSLVKAGFTEEQALKYLAYSTKEQGE